MELRCHNCGKRLKLDGITQANREVICIACGAAMIVPPARKIVHEEVHPDYPGVKRWWHRLRFGDRRKSEPEGMSRAMQRVYDPLPQWVLYTGGIVLALALLSPFWVYLIEERFKGSKILLSDDTTNIVVAASKTNDATHTPILSESPAPLEPSLWQFRGLRLNDSRDDLVHRFNLQLRNTRGMEPEVYEGEKSENWEQVKAYFYGQLLKEFSMVCREQRVSVEGMEKELIEQCGEPLQRTDTENARTPASSTLGLSGLPVGEGKNDVAHRLSSFQYRRDLVWSDSTNRVDATIYYSSKDPVLCTSMLTIHVSAAGWLKSRQPQVNTAPPAPSSNAPPVPETPVRLFP
jgi:DNA-directed RNA polymerase subunit RPC12/RpoP